MLYPVCVHQDHHDGPLGATIPDFPGCFSGADDWASLPGMIQEAVELYCDGEEMQVPAPSSLGDLVGQPEYAEGMWALVEIDTDVLKVRDGCRQKAVAALKALDALSDASVERDVLDRLHRAGGAAKCWCGCGQRVTNYFAPGHDAKAKKYLCQLHYGGSSANLPRHIHGKEKSEIANLLAMHGYGPQRSLREAFHISLLKQLL